MDATHQQTIENIHPKCMFIANSFEEGEVLFQRTKPHIVIMYVIDFSNKIYKRICIIHRVHLLSFGINK